MNIKSESEIKIEELDLEYNSYQQDSQIFSDNESDFTLKTEDIEIGELDEKLSIKSELTESEKESVLDEGLVNNGVIKYENMIMMMVEEKSCGQHSKMMKAEDDDCDDLSDNKTKAEEIGETEFLSENDHDMEEDESSFEDEEEFEGFIHSDNFKELSNRLNQMILQLRNLQSNFPQIESNISLPESEKTSFIIKLEAEESDMEFEFDEEQLKNNVIKSENPTTITKKFDAQHKFMSVKNISSLLNKVNENGLKAHFESDEEEYFAQILTSKFPLLLLKKLSYKELKNFVDGSCLDPRGGRLNVKSVSRNERKKNRKNGLKNQSCKYCNIDFKSKVEFKTHLKLQCKRKFKCSHCNYEGNNKRNLKNHMLKHRNTKLFKCSQCSYECNYKGNMKNHMLIHGNVKLFECSVCRFESNYKTCLKIHMLNHTNTKLFKCYACNYECNVKYSMKRHLLIHSDTKLFKCSECDYESNQKGHMKNHILGHTNIKLFNCPECDFKCNRKDSLKDHMLIHTNTKLFKCSHCDYECNRKGSLKVHMLSHENIKLFKCCECTFENNYKGNMKLHMRTHTKDKLFKCLECSYESNHKKKFKNHIKAKHAKM